MKQLVFTSIFLITFFLTAPAQVKEMEKAWKYYDKEKYDKAFETVRLVMAQHPNNTSLYEELIAMHLKRYQNYISATTQIDELSISAADERQNVFTSKTDGDSIATVYRENLVDILREATLKTRSVKASMYLRAMLVDKPTDLNVNEKAKEFSRKGDKFYYNKQYEEAVFEYKSALSKDPSYYIAKTYCGVSYLKNEEPDSAVVYLTSAVKSDPRNILARKYLIDAYLANNNFTEALDFCIESLNVYPDEGLFYKLNIVKKYLYSSYTLNWMPRPYFPITLNQDTVKMPIEPWNVYASAKEEIRPYCDVDGIITKQNKLTKYTQMEVYAWEKMLKSPECTDKQFAIAKSMMKRGWLDCYVMISMFHIDFYKQYLNFVDNNKERIYKYYNQILTTYR